MGIVAAVIPCWNQLKFTKEAVESIQRNSAGHAVKFIFVNNGSTDQTAQYLKRVPNSQIITNPKNMWVTHAWNQGLTDALNVPGVNVIALLNNDIKVGPEWLDAPVREIAARGDKYYFLPDGNVPEANLDAWARNALPERRGQWLDYGMCGWALFFHPDAVRKFLPIPEELKLWHNDNWIHYVLGNRHGYRRAILLDCLVKHYGSKTFNKVGNVTPIVQADTYAFERMIGQTVTEWINTRPQH